MYFLLPDCIDTKETIVTGVTALLLTVVLFIQHSPLIYYAYAGFPIFFLEEVLANRETIKAGLKILMEGAGKQVSPAIITSQLVLYIGILESLVPQTHWLSDSRYMAIFTDIFFLFVLFLQQCGHLHMVPSFGKAIVFWLAVG